MLAQLLMRALVLAGFASAALLASPVYADEPASGQNDGWTFTTQAPSGFSSGGSPGSFYFQGTPGAAFSGANGTRDFADYSIAHGLSFGRELGIGNTQATFGVRVAEPLIANGFTPALEDRRYLGAGPHVGLQGSNRLQPSLTLEWQVGASLLYGSNTFNTTGSNALPVVPNYAAGNSSVLNVDGLLGLSYWFSAASKLTVGYRADYLKGAPAVSFGTQQQSTLDHGPVVKFTIQK